MAMTGRVALILLLLAVFLEVALQVAARFAPNRAGKWRAGASIRVLCVGDSHTFGSGVAEQEAYPAQLQATLDERSEGTWSVINLGLPGMSTAQVRGRLPVQIARYRPDVVVLWAGVNDEWNSADLSYPTSWIERLDAFAMRSRLYRLVRVYLHDRALERVATGTRTEGLRQAHEQIGVCRGKACTVRGVHRFQHGGVVEVVEHPTIPYSEPRQDEERIAANLRAVEQLLTGAGVSLVLVRYPLDVGPAASANAAVARLARERNLPVVDASAAVARHPEEQVEWLWALHPNAPVYREMALDLAEVLEQLRRAPSR